MRIHRSLSALILTPALAAPLALEGVTLQHAPEDGARLTRSFTQELVLELQEHSLTFLLNGEEHPTEAGEVEVTLRDSESVKVVDTVLGSADGRVSKVQRTFESLAHTSHQEVSGPDVEESPEPEERTSALEGKTVVLTRDGDDWSAAWGEDEDGDAELLEGLEGDGGFGWLLPPGEVEVEGTWELDAAAFLAISEPLGDLHFVDAEGDGGDDAFEELFAENLEVDGLEATLVSVEDGVATVTFEGSATTLVEQEEEMPEEVEGEATSSYAFEFDVEGRFTWDLKQNRLRQLSMQAEVEMVVSRVQEMAQEGFEMSFTSEERFTGKLEIGAEVE